MNKKIFFSLFFIFFAFAFLFFIDKKVFAQSCGSPSCPGGKTRCDSIDQSPVGSCKKVWYKCCTKCRCNPPTDPSCTDPNEQGCDGGNYSDNGAVPTSSPQTCNAGTINISQGGTCGQCLTISATGCVGKPYSFTRYSCPNGWPTGPQGCNQNQAGPINGTITTESFSVTKCYSDFGGGNYCGPGQIDGAVGNPNVKTGFAIFDFNKPNANPPFCGMSCGSTPTPTPTPTPTIGLTCDGLTTNNTKPTLGSTISLTCAKNASYVGAVTYDYVLNKKTLKSDPDPKPFPTPFASKVAGSVNYTFPANQYGYYLFACQTCAGAFCSGWEFPRTVTLCGVEGDVCAVAGDCCAGYRCMSNVCRQWATF